jgi:transposase
MTDGSGAATALLGMDDFVVLSMTEHEDELWLLVETAPGPMGCPSCGVRATGHGRSTVQVRDLPASGRAVRLVWRKRRWRCGDPDCEKQTFTEQSELVEGSLTTRAAREVCRLVGEEARSVASVARRFGIGWHTAWGAVVRHGRPLVEDPRRLHGVRALGVDEHKMLAAGPDHHTIYATQLVDIDRHVLLDVVKNRSAASVSSWLDARTRYFCDHVTVAAIDPHAGYRRALVSSLPRTTITVDVFHAVKLANATVDDVRRRVQRETLGHRGRNDDPLYGIRRLLTRGYERLSDKQRARVELALRHGDPYDEVGGAWAVKEQLRCVYDADGPTGAKTRLDRFYELARIAGTAEVLRLSKTVKRWEREVLAFFVTGRTNARSEAMNLITEKLRRNAHGIRNFEHYRLRLLLHSGVQWNTRPTARIRGRHPRLIA